MSKSIVLPYLSNFRQVSLYYTGNSINSDISWECCDCDLSRYYNRSVRAREKIILRARLSTAVCHDYLLDASHYGNILSYREVAYKLCHCLIGQRYPKQNYLIQSDALNGLSSVAASFYNEDLVFRKWLDEIYLIDTILYPDSYILTLIMSKLYKRYKEFYDIFITQFSKAAGFNIICSDGMDIWFAINDEFSNFNLEHSKGLDIERMSNAESWYN